VIDTFGLARLIVGFVVFGLGVLFLGFAFVAGAIYAAPASCRCLLSARGLSRLEAW
jgi:hypothetical protein